MRKPDNSLPARIEFICGASGTRKSSTVKERIAPEKNVLVWDPKNEYGDLKGFKVTHNKAEFVKLARVGGRIAFASVLDDFEFYCRVVWARAGCLNVVEELGAVSHAAKASGTWFLLTSQGRGFGIQTIALAQRAAEVDKTVIGNASMIQVRRQNYANDVKAAAEILGVSRDAVQSLKGFEFIQRDMATGEVRDSRAPQKSPAQKSPPAKAVPLRKKAKKR